MSIACDGECLDENYPMRKMLMPIFRGMLLNMTETCYENLRANATNISFLCTMPKEANGKFIEQLTQALLLGETNFEQLFELITSASVNCKSSYNYHCTIEQLYNKYGDKMNMTNACQDCHDIEYQAMALGFLSYATEKDYNQLGSAIIQWIIDQNPRLYRPISFEFGFYNLTEILGMPGGSLHESSYQILKYLMPNSTGKPKLSLIDIPIILGSRPVQRSNQNELRSFQDVMPFSILTNLSFEGQIALISSDCEKHMNAWIDSQNTTHFCSLFELCCKSRELVNLWLRSQRSMVYKIMMHSKHQPTFEEKTDIIDILNKNSPSNFNLSRKVSSQSAFAMLPFCSFVGKDQGAARTSDDSQQLKECEDFVPVFTDVGMCYAFNGYNVWKQSYFEDSIRKSFSKLPEDRFVNLLPGVPGINDEGLTFLLDRHTLRRGDWFQFDPDYPRGTFMVSISPAKTAFEYLAHGLQVKIGYQTAVNVKPVALQSDAKVEGLPLSKRKCFFPDEANEHTSLFKEYTHAGCQYECMLELAKKTCNCIPWDFPYGNDADTDLCDYLGYFCFNKVLDNSTLTDTKCSHCLPDCNILHYELTTEVQPLNGDALCKRHVNEQLYKYLNRQFTFDKNFFLLKYLDIVHNISMSNQNCRKSLQDIAIVSVKLGQGYVLSERKLRVSTSEKIASFGITWHLTFLYKIFRFRWYFGFVHWHELHQSFRNLYVDIQRNIGILWQLT